MKAILDNVFLDIKYQYNYGCKVFAHNMDLHFIFILGLNDDWFTKNSI